MAIDRVIYFSGDIELQWGEYMRNSEFSERFPGVKGKRVDSFSMFVGPAIGSKELLPVTRIIDYKRNPSLHQCDARCRNAKGKSCECSCGGKYHGLHA